MVSRPLVIRFSIKKPPSWHFATEDEWRASTLESRMDLSDTYQGFEVDFEKFKHLSVLSKYPSE